MTDEETSEVVKADVAEQFRPKPAPVEATVDPAGLKQFLALKAAKHTGRTSEPIQPSERSDYERVVRKSLKARSDGTTPQDPGFAW